MTQKEAILYSFRINGGKMSLGQMLKYPWGYEFRARATELRKEGYTILCQKAKNASDNIYQVIPPERSGQMRLV